MRVLKGKVLVEIADRAGKIIVVDDEVRKGVVELSGSDQIKPGESVIFGDQYEELDISGSGKSKYYLMDESNIKIIFDDPRGPLAGANVLPIRPRCLDKEEKDGSQCKCA